MKKRRLSAVLAAALASVMVLGGCSQGAASGSSTAAVSAAGSQQSASSAAAKEVPTLVWYMGGDQQTDMQSVLDEVNKTLPSLIGAKLDIKIIDYGSYDEKMKLMISGSEPIDLCFSAGGWILDYTKMAEKGAFYDITDLVSKSDKIKSAIDQRYIDMMKINGKIYGLPNLQKMATCVGLSVQKKLADEYGLKMDSLTCLDDLEPFLAWVKENHPDIYGYKANNGYLGGVKGTSNTAGKGWDIQGLNSYIGAKKGSDGKVTFMSTFNSDDMKAIQALNYSWYNKGYIRKDIASVTDDSAEQKAGKYASWTAAYKPGGDVEFNTANPDCQIYWKAITSATMGGTSARGCATAIAAKSEHPDLAFKMIEEMNTNSALYNLISYGIEGKHYTKESDGCVKINTTAGYTANTWQVGNTFLAFPLVGQSTTLAKETKAFNDGATVSFLGSFSLDSTNVQTEMGQIATVIKKYAAYTYGIAAWDSYIGNYEQEMKQAGIDTVVAEAQKQWDAQQKS